MNHVENIFNRLISRVVSRIQNMVVKAILSSANDGNGIQLLKYKGLADEVQDGIERLQNYGLSSRPPKGSELLVLSLGGNKDHSVVVVADSAQYRKKDLEDGEVALYDMQGNYIHFKADKVIEVSSQKDFVIAVEEKVFLGNSGLLPTAGVVTGECADPVTGVPFPDKSSVVFAEKVKTP